MKVIAIAASKGGVGKSTLATALAVQATKERGTRVGLLDWEPQGSVSFWHRTRGSPDNPQLLHGDDPVEVAFGADDISYLFLDTAPSGHRSINRAIEAADFVLVPLHASAFDLDAVRPLAIYLKRIKKPFAIVLNEAEPRRSTLIKSTVEMLEKNGLPVLDVQIQNRTAYVSALNKGLTGPEHPDKKQREAAADEIAALWSAVKALAGKAKR